MTTIRKIRNTAIALCTVFVCGILGSLELDTITLSQAVEYITVSAIFCAFIMALEVILRFSKALLIVYARRRRASKRASLHTSQSAKRNAQLA